MRAATAPRGRDAILRFGEFVMEIILKEDVADLGFRGEVVKVADGYARNYLLPRKLAMQATAANKAVIEQMKSAAARRSASEKAQAEELVTQLEPLVLSFMRKAGEAGHLFGSVTSSDIAAELAAQGHEVDRRKIQLGDPLKSRGRLQGGDPAAPRSHRTRHREGSGGSDRGREGCCRERCRRYPGRRSSRACHGRSGGRVVQASYDGNSEPDAARIGARRLRRRVGG